MDQFRVTLTAMVGGLRAQDSPDGEPTDEWQDQVHPFDTIEAVKTWIGSLDPHVTTHVTLEHSDDDGSTWQALYVKDRGDSLEAAHVPTLEEIEAAARADSPPPPPPTPMPAQ